MVNSNDVIEKDSLELICHMDNEWRPFDTESIDIRYFGHSEGQDEGGEVRVFMTEPLPEIYRLNTVAARIRLPRGVNGLPLQRVYIPVVANGYLHEWTFRFTRELRCLDSQTVLR
jgi:hypothetical protein